MSETAETTRQEVEAAILAGEELPGSQFSQRRADAHFICSDIVFRASKELVRCDGDVSQLLPIEVAALKWADVDPADRDTWILLPGSEENTDARGATR